MMRQIVGLDAMQVNTNEHTTEARERDRADRPALKADLGTRKTHRISTGDLALEQLNDISSRRVPYVRNAISQRNCHR